MNPGSRVARVLIGLGVIGACSYPRLYLGILPEPGRTGVAPDTTLRVEIGEIRPDTPSLTAAFELIGPSGRVEMEGRYDGTFLTLTPLEPLREGDYRFDGSPEYAYRGANGHYNRGFLTGPAVSYGRTRFQVGGEPRVLGHVAWSQGLRLVIFSEPVEIGSAAGRVLVDGAAVDLVPGPDARMLGFAWETPLIVDTGFSEDEEGPVVRVLQGITSVRGPRVEPGEVEWMQDCGLELQLGQSSRCY